MEIRYKPQVFKQLERLPLAERKKVIRKIELLKLTPQVGKVLRGELEGLRSAKAWPYRIIYEAVGQMIVVYSVTHRQEAYK